MKLAEIASALNVIWKTVPLTPKSLVPPASKHAVAGQLTFVSNPKYAAAAKTTKASAVIVAEDFPAIATGMLRSKNPYLVLGAGDRALPSRAALRPRSPFHGGRASDRQDRQEALTSDRTLSSTKTSRSATTPSCWPMS